jgi:hypothetical protein
MDKRSCRRISRRRRTVGVYYFRGRVRRSPVQYSRSCLCAKFIIFFTRTWTTTSSPRTHVTSEIETYDLFAGTSLPRPLRSHRPACTRTAGISTCTRPIYNADTKVTPTVADPYPVPSLLCGVHIVARTWCMTSSIFFFSLPRHYPPPSLLVLF